MRLVALSVIVCLNFSAARADTLGLLPPTPNVEIAIPIGEKKLPNVFVYHETKELKDGLKEIAPELADALSIDFTRFMVVGVAEELMSVIVYRIELDDAAKPSKLLVRVARRGDLHASDDIRKAHLVITPISALPVSFLWDEMVDGSVRRTYPDGVASKQLGAIDGPKAESQKAEPARFREQAEQLVRQTLSAQEIAIARAALGIRAIGNRYPEPYSGIIVQRLQDSWRITYDTLNFEVDVKTGKVSRL